MNYSTYARIEAEVLIQKCLNESMTTTVEYLNRFVATTKLNSNKHEILIYALFHPVLCMLLSKKDQKLIESQRRQRRGRKDERSGLTFDIFEAVRRIKRVGHRLKSNKYIFNHEGVKNSV